jgi:hypothetical protein
VADLVERYLELGLRLGRHAEDLVDSYYGPAELASRVESEDAGEPAALAEDAAELAAELEREPWLAAQVRTLGATARKLAGERLDYATWSLQPDDRVAKQVDSQVRSTSPPYAHTYWQGRELVAAYVGGDPARFRELLTARVLPSELRESA